MARGYLRGRLLDKDPAIDVVRRGFEVMWTTRQKSLTDIAQEARVSPATIKDWLYGKTKKPQRYTMSRVLAALGIDMQFVWIHSGKAVEVSSISSRAWSKTKVKQLNEDVVEPIAEQPLVAENTA